MTLARQKHTPRERQIAKALDLSDAQLDALLRIRSGYWPGNAAAALEAKGLAWRAAYGTPEWGKSGLTEAGEACCSVRATWGFE